MKTIKVVFADGDSFITRINGSREEIEKYYIGNWFNMGTVADDMKQVTSIEFLATEKIERMF